MAATPDILVRFGGSVDSSFDASLKRLKSGSVDVQKGFSGISSAINALGAGASIAYLTKTAVSLQQIDLSLQAVFGSSEAASSEFEYLRGVAQRLGVDVMSLAESYVSFAAAAQGTTFEGAQTKRIFEAITGAMSKLGMPSERVKDALNAVQQMMSKGKVQAEELRGQLGENLPGAFNLAAKAMGVTTAQLDKMLESGQVTAEKLLPNLAIELEKLYKTNDRMTGVVSEWNRFKSSIQDVAQEFGKTLLPAITSILQELTPATRETKSFLGWVGERVAAFVTGGSEGDKLARAMAHNSEEIASKNKEINKLLERQKGLRSDTSAYSGEARKWVDGRISALKEEIKLLEVRNGVLRKALDGAPQLDEPSPSGAQGSSSGAPQGQKKQTVGGPSDEYKKMQDKVAEDRRKEDDAKMSDAARVAQYELEIARELSAEKQAITKGDEDAAERAQKKQEEALKNLANAGASRARVDLWSRQVGAPAEAAPQMEVKAKVAMVVDTAAMAAIPEEIRKAIATTGTLGPLPLEIIPILVDDTPTGSNPVANAADAAGSRAE